MKKEITDVNHLEIQHICVSEKRDNGGHDGNWFKHYLLLKVNERPHIVSVSVADENIIFNNFCPCGLYTCLSDAGALQINKFVEAGFKNGLITKPVNWLNGDNAKLGTRFNHEHYAAYGQVTADDFFTYHLKRDEFKEFFKVGIINIIKEKENQAKIS